TKRPQCSHCGLIGHTVDKCYKRIGYPPVYRNGKRPATANAFQGFSSTPAPSVGPSKSVEDDVCHNDAETVSITKDQYQSLYSLFQGHSSGSEALGPAPTVHCVTTGQTFGPVTSSAQGTIPYVPSGDAGTSTGNQQGHQEFSEDWYS
ncbi:hypothetical protein LINPERHAP2_LOCUS4160, partial [Linum perenne]